jgi:predicted RNA-binding Zn-ribbon protein involved in translation (DUF1610 family)
MPDLEALACAVIGDPRGRHACPACGHERLTVEDRSARPHMLWIVLSCPACGFADTINAALAGG